MRVLLLVSMTAVATTACAGPHSTGALWAQQNLEHERILYQQSDAQRAQQAHAYELSLADAALQGEHERIATQLQACPGPAQPFTASPGDTIRDSIRLQIEGDPDRLTQLANVALADWYARRANATQIAAYCQQAANAISGSGNSAAGESGPPLLDGLPGATVTRDVARPATMTVTDEPAVRALTEYALGYTDAVTAAAPLPYYLALVYGGTVTNSTAAMSADAAAASVDSAAPSYPDWEPDALYAALRGGRL